MDTSDLLLQIQCIDNCIYVLNGKKADLMKKLKYEIRKLQMNENKGDTILSQSNINLLKENKNETDIVSNAKHGIIKNFNRFPGLSLSDHSKCNLDFLYESHDILIM